MPEARPPGEKPKTGLGTGILAEDVRPPLPGSEEALVLGRLPTLLEELLDPSGSGFETEITTTTEKTEVR